MNKISVKKIIDYSWNLLLKRQNDYLAAALIFAAVNLSETAVLKSLNSLIITLTVQVLFTLLNFSIAAGLFHFNLLEIRGKNPKLEAIAGISDPKIYLRFAVIQILYGLAAVVGMIFFIFPGFYILSKYIAAGVISIDRNKEIGESFQKSGELTEGHKTDITGLILFTIALVMILLVFIFTANIVLDIVLTIFFKSTAAGNFISLLFTVLGGSVIFVLFNIITSKLYIDLTADETISDREYSSVNPKDLYISEEKKISDVSGGGSEGDSAGDAETVK